MDQQSFRSRYCKWDGFMPKWGTIEKQQKTDFSYIYSKNIPLHYKEAGWPEWEQHWHFLICMHCPLEDFVPKTKQIYSVRNHEYKKRSPKKHKYQLCIYNDSIPANYHQTILVEQLLCHPGYQWMLQMLPEKT